MSLRLIGCPYDERCFAGLRRLASGKPVAFDTAIEDTGLIEAYQKLTWPMVVERCLEPYRGRSSKTGQAA